MGLKVARNAPSISHLFFADDSLLFLKASERNVQTIQKVFQLYADCSGQVKRFNSLCFKILNKVQFCQIFKLASDSFTLRLVRCFGSFYVGY